MIVLCMFSLENPKVMLHNAAISSRRLLIVSNSYSSVMNSTNTRRDLVMWLWQVHNEVHTSFECFRKDASRLQRSDCFYDVSMFF